MIVRILSEGQYTVPSSLLDELNVLDNKLVNSVATEDESSFRSLYDEILSLVRSKGKELPIEELHPSDVRRVGHREHSEQPTAAVVHLRRLKSSSKENFSKTRCDWLPS